MTNKQGNTYPVYLNVMSHVQPDYKIVYCLRLSKLKKNNLKKLANKR